MSLHHSHLNVAGVAFRRALERGVARGQLEQLTGKGASGTFQLVDGAAKTGTDWEDAIEDAIIAMNEPKDASVPGLRHYLSEFHTEYNVAERPKVDTLHSLCQDDSVKKKNTSLSNPKKNVRVLSKV